VFLETYVQAAASLAYIRQITRVTYQLLDSPSTVGRGVAVSGRFNQVGYGVAAFICYPYVCFSEYVCDLAYLWGNVCKCCPFLVFATTRNSTTKKRMGNNPSHRPTKRLPTHNNT